MMNTLYWFSIPFVNAFNISETLINPLIIAIFAIVFYTMLGKFKLFRFELLEGLLGVFFCCIILSTCINISTIDTKAINHLVAIITCYSIFYYAVVCFSRDLTFEEILATLWVGYIFTTVFGLVEFALVNFAGMDLSVIPRPSVPIYHPGFLDIVLIRSRSLFEESGYYAAYLCITAPLLAYYLWWVRPTFVGKMTFILLSLSSYFVAFSVSLFIFLPLAVLLPTILHVVARRRVTHRWLLGFSALLIIIIYILSSDTLMNILFYRKFDSESFVDRNEKFMATLDLMIGADWYNLLFGYGPGSYLRCGVPPSISVYVNFLRDFGLIGLGAYILFIVAFLRQCYADRSSIGKSIFISALVVQMLYIAMPVYFLPSYFIPLVMHKIKKMHDRRVRTLTTTTVLN